MPVARRYIDPDSRSYVVENGAPRASDSVVGEALIRLLTPLGTFVPDPSFGSRFHEIRKLTRDASRRANVFASLALAPMLKKGVLRSVTPECSVEGSTLEIVVGLVTAAGDQRTVRTERTV